MDSVISYTQIQLYSMDSIISYTQIQALLDGLEAIIQWVLWGCQIIEMLDRKHLMQCREPRAETRLCLASIPHVFNMMDELLVEQSCNYLFKLQQP